RPRTSAGCCPCPRCPRWRSAPTSCSARSSIRRSRSTSSPASTTRAAMSPASAAAARATPPPAPRTARAAAATSSSSRARSAPTDSAAPHADSKDEMLSWLSANHYFVPAGTDDVVGPYIHKDAYFLALKLRGGESTGSLQPVVVKYASDLPMIPIVLTSVAAQ